MTMTLPELRAFFGPHIRAACPVAEGPRGAAAPAGAAETLFVSLDGIRLWAAHNALPLRAAMVSLLGANVWPERFRRNFGLFSAAQMARLLHSRVLVLGCGGLGGHVAELLARTGLGGLRLVDDDVFEESNLNRQRFCGERALGLSKALTAREALRDMASHMDVEALQLRADATSLPGLVAGMDLALDCLDDIAAKTALEKAALAAGVPFIHGSVLRDEGFCYANAGPEARLAQLYPEGQSPRQREQARREGVSALAPAAVACLMVRLALRALLEHSADSPLFHLDLSVPELEPFAWPDSA